MTHAAKAPFAAVAQMVNDATERTVANALATFEGSEPFPVVFDQASANPLGLVEAAGLSAGFQLKHAPGLRHGNVLHIDRKPYTVAGGLEPDSSGWVEVQLREACA